MPFAVWCILIAAILPFAAIYPGKFSREFDNSKPRDPDYWKDGFRARARAAESNSFEAFPFFAIAVIVGLGQGGDPDWIDRLAGLFVAVRVIFVFCYLTDRPTPRSLAWAVGFFSTVAIFTSPVWS
ncbi:hypothetical protein GR183_17825 [Stappia sp. GBMRC 2046]|uniref:MAPEG family protein n=1 Tax=Stappia sediminis TaxID=2692190 RepID=A0A7X3LX61_9HYPH|nr:MAPEG family protein [Stappia sediminis]MXN66776.1 hypothetical protein [Stappia sediminis]